MQVVGDQGNKEQCQAPQEHSQHQPETMGWCQLGLDGTDESCSATCGRAGLLEHQMCGTAEVGGQPAMDLPGGWVIRSSCIAKRLRDMPNAADSQITCRKLSS